MSIIFVNAGLVGWCGLGEGSALDPFRFVSKFGGSPRLPFCFVLDRFVAYRFRFVLFHVLQFRAEPFCFFLRGGVSHSFRCVSFTSYRFVSSWAQL